jgi:pilus assembly protein CpaE
MNALIGPNTPERTTMHILNRNGSPGSLPIAEFTRGSGAAPDVAVPWSRQIALAVNQGVKAAPDCPVLDNALAPLFARVAGEGIHEPVRSWFQKLLG